MTDPRYTKLAQTLIHYSCELKAGEKRQVKAGDALKVRMRDGSLDAEVNAVHEEPQDDR